MAARASQPMAAPTAGNGSALSKRLQIARHRRRSNSIRRTTRTSSICYRQGARAPRGNRQSPCAIFGLLEARLQSVDRIVLGGLNESTWPPDTRNDRG